MWMAAMWRSNADMYVTVTYNKVLFSVLYFFLTSQSEVDFGMTIVTLFFAKKSLTKTDR